MKTELHKYLQQLEILKLYMRLKIEYDIEEDFEYFLHNIRVRNGFYTYEKYVNLNTFSHNYSSDFAHAKTTKLYDYD